MDPRIRSLKILLRGSKEIFPIEILLESLSKYGEKEFSEIEKTVKAERKLRNFKVRIKNVQIPLREISDIALYFAIQEDKEKLNSYKNFPAPDWEIKYHNILCSEFKRRGWNPSQIIDYFEARKYSHG